MKKKDLKEQKIAVFMGGVSEEREISLKSGNAVFDALKRLGLNTIKVDITTDNPLILKKEIKSYGVDLVFIALHGTFGEDGSMQKILEEMGIAYTGSDSRASRLAMDKIASKESFIKAGLDVPQFLVIHETYSERVHIIIEKIGFPLVVKPAASGSSIGLSLVEKKEDLKDAFALAKKFGNSIIVEKFIKSKEVTVGILDDKPLPPIEIIPDQPFFNFQAKYESEKTNYIVPAKIEQDKTNHIQDVALRAHSSLSCRCFSRVDMLFDEKEDKVYCLEVNTIPGLTERSLLPKAAYAIGLDFGQLCLKIIESARL